MTKHQNPPTTWSMASVTSRSTRRATRPVLAQTLRNRRIEMYGPDDEAPEELPEDEEPWVTLAADEEAQEVEE
jgi:hypothetical protein